MNRTIRQYHAIIYIVLFYLLMAVLLLFPCGILKKDRTVAGSENIVKTAEVRLDQQVQQVFVADGDYLRYLELYVNSPDSAGERYHLYVYDEHNEILINREIAMQEVALPGFLRIPIGIETVPGTAYVWQLQGTDTPMELGIENTGETGLTVFGNYYVLFDGKTTMHEAQNVVMRLIYTDSPAGKKMAVLYLCLFTAALSLVIWAYYQGNIRKKLQKRISLQQLLLVTAGPVLWIFTGYLLYTVFVQNLFGGKRADKMVYGLGIGLAAVYFTWVLLAKRPKKEEVPFQMLCREKGMDWLQSAMFAGALLGGIHFMNAQYQIFQDLAYREVLIWSGLILLTMASGRGLLQKKNGLWTGAVGLLGGIRYFLYKTRLPEGKSILDAKLLRNDILAVLVFGLVAMALFDKIRKKQFDFSKVNYRYAGLLALFFVMIVLFRNTRGWPIYLVFVFGLFYLFYLGWENRGRLLENFCNGIMLNFALAVIFAMARRPFRAWVYSRYNFVFHTVTITATYLTLIVCALTVRLLIKLQEKKRLADLWGTLLLYGLSVAFLFLTLSRTGYLAVIVMTVILVPFVVFFCNRKRLAAFIKAVAVMAAAALLCVPVAYSGVRLLPALYNDPYIYEVEESAAAIHKDDPKDSNGYMSISFFQYVVDSKLLSDATETEEFRQILFADKDSLYVKPQSVLTASAGENDLSGLEEFSNGRFKIFSSYIDHWNLTGHEEMGVPLPDGSISVHAHNTYLQVIHDHGLLTGVVYLLFGAVSAVMMFVYALKKREEDSYAALPLAIFIGFAVAGLVEWLFHPCNPMGFSTMVIFAPLLCFTKSGAERNIIHFGKRK